MTTDRWVTFDCFGTLIDWHTGYRAILAPIADGRTDELIQAYHSFERTLEPSARTASIATCLPQA